MNVVPGTTLSITPSNLTSTTVPKASQFIAAVGKIPYGVLNINPGIGLSSSKRYIIEFMAEAGSAYAMQMVKNPARYINLTRKRSSTATDTSQGRAFTSITVQKPTISMPQVWGCHPQQGPDVATETANNAGRFFNCASKLYTGASTYTHYYAQVLPVCLKAPT